YRPYTDMERSLLRQALYEAADLPDRVARPGCLREAERVVTSAHAEAVAAFTAQHRMRFDDIDIVGFHGQTVLHRPEKKLTVQIGDALIACDTGPGNALLDDYMFRWLNQRFDTEGRTAALGKVDAAWIARALEMPFFSLPPPKSLDRNDFARLRLGDVPPEDGAATL